MFHVSECLKKPQQKKKAYFHFQEVCDELSKLSGLPFGVCLALWKKHGNRINQLLAEIKQGEVKNVKAYLLFNLKNNVGKESEAGQSR